MDQVLGSGPRRWVGAALAGAAIVACGRVGFQPVGDAAHADAVRPPDADDLRVVGCADGAREAFVDWATFPTIAGTRLTETVRWYRWRLPAFARATLPTGAGMLREVGYARPFKTRWRVVLYTSGGSSECTYRDEASLQADLDELRALCPSVPISTR